MMTNYLKYFCLLAFIGGFVGCVDQDFDEPPTEGVSDLMATHTIAELKELHRSGVNIEIADSIIIEGSVISDDAQGNFFKNMIIQDETGGIELRINQNNLQAVYQRGRIVYVKCKGLSIGDYNDFIQLGLGDDGSGGLGRIPETLVDQFIEKGDFPDNPVEPTDVLISGITPEMVGTLIRLNDVEFSRDDFNKAYADPSGTSGTNRIIEDCLGGEITIRTSDFCDFAGDLTPFGNGTIVGVASVFGSTRQILIRDTDDVRMEGTPCNRSGEPASRINIGELRDIFSGSPVTAPDAKFVQGIVTSDQTTMHTDDQNLVIQDATGGILIRFIDAHSIPRNEEIKIDISGLELDEFRGWLQVQGTPNDRVERLGAQPSPTPATVTISEILADFENYESSLVKIEMAELSSTGTFSGSIDVTDASGTMTMFTSSFSTFASEFVPTGTVAITAIVTQGGNNDEQQLSLRDPMDVEGGMTGGNDPIDAAFVDFEDQGTSEDIAIRGWQNLSIKGNRTWWGKDQDGTRCAQATGFGSGLAEMEVWLVTPKLNLDVITEVQFDSQHDFWVHDGLSVIFSEDYDGNNPGAATWVDLNARVAIGTDPDETWIPSGPIDLSAYDGIGHVAFVYKGDGNANTSSYRIDNIEIK